MSDTAQRKLFAIVHQPVALESPTAAKSRLNIIAPSEPIHELRQTVVRSNTVAAADKGQMSTKELAMEDMDSNQAANLRTQTMSPAVASVFLSQTHEIIFPPTANSGVSSNLNGTGTQALKTFGPLTSPSSVPPIGGSLQFSGILLSLMLIVHSISIYFFRVLRSVTLSSALSRPMIRWAKRHMSKRIPQNAPCPMPWRSDWSTQRGR